MASVTRLWGLIHASSALYQSNRARIWCTVAAIPVTLGQVKNKKYEGGYVENLNRCGKLFSRNSRFDSRTGIDEGSGD
jgi:hypothetical protein